MIDEKMKNNRKVIIWPSIVLVIVIFSVFIVQIIYTGHTSFAAVGDQQKLSYPAFVRLGYYLRHGILGGVDTTTFNGASEFFSRSNLTVLYFPLLVASLIGNVTSLSIEMYILFFAFQFFICIYYAQRVGIEYFGLKQRTAFLFASSCVCCILYEIWYTGFGVITTLVFPLLYFSLRVIHERKLVSYISIPLTYVLAFTSGYVTVAVALAAIIFIVSTGYIYFDEKVDKKGEKLFRLFLCVMIGVFISFMYYLNLLHYVKSYVQSALDTLDIALSIPVNTRDFMKIFFNSYIPKYPIEQINILYIGVIWVSAIYFILKKKVLGLLKVNLRIFCQLVLIINLVFLLISLGNDTPLAIWFYTFVPILGQMHLPIRFMMITIPLGFLALCTLLERLEDEKNDTFKYLAYASLILCLIAWIISIVTNDTTFNYGRLVVELVFTAIIFYYIYKEGWHAKKTLFLWSGLLLVMGVQCLYDETGLLTRYDEFANQHIEYNADEQEKLKQFIHELPAKDLYRYVCMDNDNPIGPFVTQNYPWLIEQDYNLSNYYGYELQLASPADYTNKFPWFDRLTDWQYIVDTRCDFLILKQSVIDANRVELDKIVDWKNSNVYLNNIYRICRLKKFIPSYLSGPFVEERDGQGLDNGYIYSPQLNTGNLNRFMTDGSTYYFAEISSSVPSDVVLLPYAHKNYKYYIDGVQVQADIHNMQAFLKLPSGTHKLKIMYVNPVQFWGNRIIIGYYFLSILALLYLVITKKIRREKR